MLCGRSRGHICPFRQNMLIRGGVAGASNRPIRSCGFGAGFEVLMCVRSVGWVTLCCWTAGGCRLTYSVHACACDHVYTDREMYKLCVLLAQKDVGIRGLWPKMERITQGLSFKCLQFTVGVFPPWIQMKIS